MTVILTKQDDLQGEKLDNFQWNCYGSHPRKNGVVRERFHTSSYASTFKRKTSSNLGVGTIIIYYGQFLTFLFFLSLSLI